MVTAADPNAPVIKRAVSIPGDTFTVSNDGSVIVNGVAATVPSGEPYHLTARGIEMLDLYQSDYHGVIPAGSYLLLGDVPGGALNSSRIGLVSAQEIIGVVTRVQQSAPQ